MAAADVLERLNELAVRWELPAAAVSQLQTILDLLAVEATAITTVREPRAGVEVHVADSLTGLAVPALSTASAIADLGSGGGFPGLALAVARPSARVTLVESVGKKVDFLRRAVAAARLENAVPIQARAESWAAGHGAQDVVTARAVAPLNVLAEYAAPLLREGGTLVAWKGVREPREEADGAAAAALLGLEPAGIVPVEGTEDAQQRHLYLYLKVRATPSRYPRREGMARKRPLRASTRA